MLKSLCLGAMVCGTLAVQHAQGAEIFRQTTVGADATWVAHTATFTPTESGNYTLGFNLLSANPSVYPDSTVFLDNVRVTSGETELFHSGFESPPIGGWFYPFHDTTGSWFGSATFGDWVFTNYSGVIAGNPWAWGSTGPQEGNQRGFLQAYFGGLSSIQTTHVFALQAGQTYTVTFYQMSRQGYPTGTTYNVTFDQPRDTTPPVINSITPSTATLWPPNHQMVPVSVRVDAFDNVGIASIAITGVQSSEPDNGLGDGDMPNDVQLTRDPLTVNLRAERSGKGNGRTYTIFVAVTDTSGNVTTGSCTVSVPKSQGK